jgi:hypothetical protein
VHVAVYKPATSSTDPFAARRQRSERYSQRDQLLAAAASLVWFAGWFQAIYDEIAGHAPDAQAPHKKP